MLLLLLLLLVLLLSECLSLPPTGVARLNFCVKVFVVDFIDVFVVDCVDVFVVDLLLCLF